MSLKNTIKENVPGFLKEAWRNSQKLSKKKTYEALKNFVEKNDVIKRLFSEKVVDEHYGTRKSRNNVFHPDLFINQIRYFRLWEYFQTFYPEIFKDEIKVLNAGDSSGVLLNAMGKKGVSLDIDPHSVQKIKNKGIEAYQGSIYQLPFPEKSFDYSMSFQCLEHLDSPMLALKELERVTRKRIFISIPYREDTRVCNKEYWDDIIRKPEDQGGWNVKEPQENFDYHIFEFSAKDFISLLSYTGLECERHYPINYLEPIGATSVNKGSYFNFFDIKVKNG
ncbi:MAG: class I SAM-dependent methyltransferase [Candidatus Omnitrophica bacterium]|nr:class I SAM-dependent methyltransferase [Candidatus Omnitrophota bacterium]